MAIIKYKTTTITHDIPNINKPNQNDFLLIISLVNPIDNNIAVGIKVKKYLILVKNTKHSSIINTNKANQIKDFPSSNVALNFFCLGISILLIKLLYNCFSLAVSSSLF